MECTACAEKSQVIERVKETWSLPILATKARFSGTAWASCPVSPGKEVVEATRSAGGASYGRRRPAEEGSQQFTVIALHPCGPTSEVSRDLWLIPNHHPANSTPRLQEFDKKQLDELLKTLKKGGKGG